MADYFTRFSCLLDVGSPENASRALELYERPLDDDASTPLVPDGFELSIEPPRNGTQLWIRADADGDPERVVQFVKCCAAEFQLTGRWGFQFANSCSRPRLDGFGGGAHILDLETGETVGWISTDEWLAAALAGGDADA